MVFFSLLPPQVLFLYGELETIVDFVAVRPLLELCFFGNGTGEISEGVTNKSELQTNCCISDSVGTLFKERPGNAGSVDCPISGSATSQHFTSSSASLVDITPLLFNS